MRAITHTEDHQGRNHDAPAAPPVGTGSGYDGEDTEDNAERGRNVAEVTDIESEVCAHDWE
jgi:hypothetical protein